MVPITSHDQGLLIERLLIGCLLMVIGKIPFQLYTTRGKHLTALTINKNRKLLAFAQRGDRPHVVVFDLAENKRKKVMKLKANCELRFVYCRSADYLNFERKYARVVTSRIFLDCSTLNSFENGLLNQFTTLFYCNSVLLVSQILACSTLNSLEMMLIESILLLSTPELLPL